MNFFSFQKDPNVRLVTLYTLNNLMPCIDRQRVADTTMRIINTHFDVNTAGQSLSTTYLLILQNMAAFSSAHSTLLSLDIIPLLDQVATLAVKDHNTGIESAHYYYFHYKYYYRQYNCYYHRNNNS